MRAATHVSFSQLLYLLMVSSAGLALSPLAAAGAAVASVAPDVDSGAALVGRLFPPLTRWLETRFGHRTITHSALAVAAVIVVLLPVALVDKTLYICLIIGYASHPVLDSMTVTGVQLFYPFSTVRCVFPMDTKHPHRYRVRTGGSTDTTLGITFLLLCVPAYLVARTGHAHLIRSVQQDIESAVREYRELEHGFAVYAALVAKHTLSGETLSGTFEVVGAPDARTILILDSTGTLRSVGVRGGAEFLSEEILCRRGEPRQTESQEHDLTGRPLGESFAGNRPEDLYLFGELQLDESCTGVEKTPWFSPVRCSGATLTLEYARGADLVRMGLAGALVRQGSVRTVHRGEPRGGDPDAPRPSITRLELKGAAFRLRCSEGDLIVRDSILAVSATYDELIGQASTLRMKQALLAGEHRMDVATQSGRLAAARGAIAVDSARVLNLSALLREEFTGPARLAEARDKLTAARALVGRLEAELHQRSVRYEVQSAELREKLQQIQRLASRATLRTRSPGRIRSIRITEGRLTILLEEQ